MNLTVECQNKILLCVFDTELVVEKNIANK